MDTKMPGLPEVEFAKTYVSVSFGQIIKINYDCIESITFKTMGLLPNRFLLFHYPYVPSGRSLITCKLALHLSDQRTVWVNRGWDFEMSTARMVALCAAAEFLSENTFERRFERYKRQLDQAGAFSYGKHLFFRNGDVFKANKRICNVRDGSAQIGLGPFHVHLSGQSSLQKLGSWLRFSGDTIDISKDRDCFLSMYRLLYKVQWPDEHYRDDSCNHKR